MQGLQSNQYILEEVFQASTTEVFEHLTRFGSIYSLGCDSEIMSPLSLKTDQALDANFGLGYTWREHRRHLFLRDVMHCEITQCERPVALGIVTNDGFNQLKYDFKLAELGPTVTTVHCTVYCYTHPTGEGQPASPSEKLAIMMRNQDRLAIRQLKGAMEDGHALSVC